MKCKICKSASTHFFTKVDKWELQKCENCGFVEVIQEPSTEELKKIYSILYFQNIKYGDKKTQLKEYYYRLNLLKKYVPFNSNLLDYGCAQADFIDFAKNKYFFIGLDFSTAAIEKAKEKYPHLKGDLYNLNNIDKIQDNSLEGVVMWDVIEHLWDPQEVVSSLLDKLKENGYLFISTPKVDSFFANALKKFWPFMTPPEHLSFFSQASFKIFADVNHLEIVETRSKGKWVNVGFMFYKIKRIAPKLVPTVLINFFNLKYTSHLSLYAPTGDIQYLVFKKL